MSNDAAFDPTAPLPGPPDPWAFTGTPSQRSGPPYHMTEMIEAEPGLARRIAARQAGPDSQAAALAAAVRQAAEAGQPIVVTGCGTSEHGAQAMAEILGEAIRRAGLGGQAPLAAQAFELALDAQSSGLLIGVSHEGGTGATNAALTAARANGARTALITVSGRSPGAALVDLVVETGELDQGWCHTVGYLSPVLAAAAVGGHLTGTPLDGDAAAAVLAAGTQDAAGAERIAGRFADAAHLIVIASGADRAAGRELTLKVEEASWLPSAYRDLETFLHGHIPATDGSTALVLVLTDRTGRAERLARARQALAAAAVLGSPVRGDPCRRPRRRPGSGPDPCRAAAGRRSARPGVAGRGAAGHRDPAPAPDRADRPGARHEPGPDPSRRPALRRGRERRRRLTPARPDPARRAAFRTPATLRSGIDRHVQARLRTAGGALPSRTSRPLHGRPAHTTVRYGTRRPASWAPVTGRARCMVISTLGEAPSSADTPSGGQPSERGCEPGAHGDHAAVTARSKTHRDDDGWEPGRHATGTRRVTRARPVRSVPRPSRRCGRGPRG